MTDFFTAIEAALVTAIGGTTPIYDSVAPLGTTAPWIVFQHISGGMENDTPLVAVDVTYRIEAVDTTAAGAKTKAGAIHAALHDQPLTVSGYNVYRTRAERFFALTEEFEGKLFYRRGFFCRISLNN